MFSGSFFYSNKMINLLYVFKKRVENMDNKTNTFKIKINGENLFLKGDLSDNKIDFIEETINNKIIKFRDRYTTLTERKLFMVAMISICEEFYDLKDEFEQFIDAFDEK